MVLVRQHVIPVSRWVRDKPQRSVVSAKVCHSCASRNPRDLDSRFRGNDTYTEKPDLISNSELDPLCAPYLRVATVRI